MAFAPRSLGFRTELLFHRDAGVVTEGDAFWTVATPSNPSFYFGNLLYFPAPPEAEDVERWPARFGAAFADAPEVKHMTFAWDGGERGAADAFVARGFHLEAHVAMRATAETLRRAPRANGEAEVRRLASDAEWEAMVVAQVASREPHHEAAGFERYLRGRAAQWRRLADAGRGAWWGAFLCGRLVADCGLFFWDGLGRFQSVQTLPEHRRRGLCARLLHDVAADGLRRAPELIIVAAGGEPAERIYASLGFVEAERMFAVYRGPTPSPRDP